MATKLTSSPVAWLALFTVPTLSWSLAIEKDAVRPAHDVPWLTPTYGDVNALLTHVPPTKDVTHVEVVEIGTPSRNVSPALVTVTKCQSLSEKIDLPSRMQLSWEVVATLKRNAPLGF